MNDEFIDLPPADARRQHAADLARRRGEEHADALDFLVFGDEAGRHAEHCVHAEKCSRTYDPLPVPEAEPVDLRLYEGTAVGALYGFGPLTSYHAAQLAGWTLAPRTTR